MRNLLYYRDKFDISRSREFRVPSELFTLSTQDGVRIVGSRLAGEGPTVFLVVHGLMAHHRAPGLQEFAESLVRFGEVWTIDLRGHGLSGGDSTLGNLEALDVAAAVRWIRTETSLPLVLVGFSMGAAASTRSAALHESVDGLISISGPGRWTGPRRWAAHRTALMWRVPGASTFVRAITGVRLAGTWSRNESPCDVIGKVSPAPVLVVHGTDDQFFPPSEAEDLHDASGEPRALWVIDGGGHAEGLFVPPRSVPNPLRVDGFVNELTSRFFDTKPPA